MKIVNLTQHPATDEQIAAGVVEPADKALVRRLLTFDTAPTKYDMLVRATHLAGVVKEAGGKAAMIGGAPFFMSLLERALMKADVKPLYSFSQRESVEVPAPPEEGGGVRKHSVFRHVCFVSP